MICSCVNMTMLNAQESTIQRLGSKRVIEQLLKQGTFARYFEVSGHFIS